MTVTELHDSYYHQLNRAGAYILGDIEPEEVDLDLNKSQIQYILSRIDDVTPVYPPNKTGFDVLKRVTDLSTLLIMNDNVTVTNNIISFLNKPVLFFFGGTVLKGSCVGVPIVAKKAQWEHVIEQNPFARSNNTFINAYITNNQLEIKPPNGLLVTEAEINYVRYPEKISLALNQTSELPDYTHEKIISLAVTTALAKFESQRYNTQSVEDIKLD